MERRRAGDELLLAFEALDVQTPLAVGDAVATDIDVGCGGAVVHLDGECRLESGAVLR